LTEVPWLFEAPTGANKVTVYWDGVPGATGYRVRWGTTSGSYPNRSAVLPATARQYTVSGLVRDREYYFVVEAAYNGLWGPPSEEDSAVPHEGAIPWDTQDPNQIIPAIRAALGVYDGEIIALSPDGWYYPEIDAVRRRESVFYIYSPDSPEVMTVDGRLLQPMPQRRVREECTRTGPYRRVKTSGSVNAVAVMGEFYLPPRRHLSANIFYFDLPQSMWNPSTGTEPTRDTPHVYFGMEYKKEGGEKVDIEAMLALNPAGRGNYNPNNNREEGNQPGSAPPAFDRWLIMLNVPKPKGGRNYLTVGEPLSYGVNGQDAPYGFVVWMMLRLEGSDAKLVSFHVHAWKYVLEDHQSDPPSYKQVVVGCAYKREPVPPPDSMAQMRRNITIAQRQAVVSPRGGWIRTGSFFLKCGVGYAPLFAQENLQEVAIMFGSGEWRLWTSDISEAPVNCPPSGVITLEQPIEPWYREVVNIDLRRR
jgi:hypothetical protein